MADVQDPDTKSTWFSWNKARTSAYTHTTDVHMAGDCKLTRITVVQAADAEAMPRTCEAQVLGMLHDAGCITSNSCVIACSVIAIWWDIVA